jgi:hypothetical protein
MHFTVQREGDCADRATGCAQIFLEYPEVEKYGESGTADSINEVIREFVLGPFLGEGRPDSVGALIAQFIGAYRTAKKEYQSATSWTLERHVFMARDTLGIAALAMRWYEFTGGAHPNTRTEYASFEVRTGKRLRLSDLLFPGKGNDLNAIAETTFRILKRLPSEGGLASEGFWFENDQFRVNDNFLLEADSLLIHFNTYEIGPYAMGPTSLKIPYSSLAGIVRSPPGVHQ